MKTPGDTVAEDTGRGGRSLILGIGVDLCRIARMKDAITSEYFVKRIFAPEEIEYARSQKDPEQRNNSPESDGKRPQPDVFLAGPKAQLIC